MKKTFIDRKPFWHVNFAHRGLFDNRAGIPENSIAAFKAAVKKGYAVELDVRLTKDGEVVVFHDDNLKRMCNVNAKISDMTLSELNKIRLLNTNETIPSLNDVLRELEKGNVTLLCELKAVKEYKKLCEKTLKLLQTYKGKYCIESFNPFVVRWFEKKAPWVFRGQLATTYAENSELMGKFWAWLFANCYMTFYNRPHFIAYKNVKRPKHVMKYCKKYKDVMLFAWTSIRPDIDQEQNDAVIFEQYRPETTY